MITQPCRPDAVLFELSSFLRVVWEALEAGAEHARTYAERLRLPSYQPEPALFSMLTRSVAKEIISERCQIGVDEFHPQNVRNIGLRARVGKYDIIIWKSPDDRIPYRKSGPQRRFLNQGFQLAFDLATWTRGVNLVVLWNADNHHRVTDVFLAMPRQAPEELFQPADAYWTIAVQHPAVSIEPASRPDFIEEPTLEFEPLEDARESRADDHS